MQMTLCIYLWCPAGWRHGLPMAQQCPSGTLLPTVYWRWLRSSYHLAYDSRGSRFTSCQALLVRIMLPHSDLNALPFVGLSVAIATASTASAAAAAAVFTRLLTMTLTARRQQSRRRQALTLTSAWHDMQSSFHITHLIWTGLDGEHCFQFSLE